MRSLRMFLVPWLISGLGLIPGLGVGGLQAMDPTDRLARVDRAMAALKSWTGKIRIHEVQGDTSREHRGRFLLKKPNLVRIEIDDPAIYVLASDGRTLYLLYEDGRRYRTSVPGESGDQISLTGAPSIQQFFVSDLSLRARRPDHRVEALPPQDVGGERLHRVRLSQIDGAGDPITSVVFLIDDHDRLRGSQLTLPRRNLGYICELSDLRFDPVLAPAEFAYQPPSEAEHRVLPLDRLLKVGEEAPGVELPRLGGGTRRLPRDPDSRDGEVQRVTLVTFWYASCGPCRVELPTIQELSKLGPDVGLDVITVNRGDPSGAIEAFMRRGGYDFEVLLSGRRGSPEGRVLDLYQVAGYPTNYLVAPDGTVLYRSVGFDPEGLDAILARIGIPLRVRE